MRMRLQVQLWLRRRLRLRLRMQWDETCFSQVCKIIVTPSVWRERERRTLRGNGVCDTVAKKANKKQKMCASAVLHLCSARVNVFCSPLGCVVGITFIRTHTHTHTATLLLLCVCIVVLILIYSLLLPDCKLPFFPLYLFFALYHCLSIVALVFYLFLLALFCHRIAIA